MLRYWLVLAFDVLQVTNYWVVGSVDPLSNGGLEYVPHENKESVALAHLRKAAALCLHVSIEVSRLYSTVISGSHEHKEIGEHSIGVRVKGSKLL